ncbi:alanine--glyoxylate aminotransferase family protein [soil metagenome]
MPAQNLRIPGPTPLPDAVREAGSRQMVNHRGPEFKALLGSIAGRLRPAFSTEQEVLVVTASGTGGLESAVVTFLSPGDAVLSVSVGVFGDRLASIASAYGAAVTKPDIEWGRAADPGLVRDAVRAMASQGRPPMAILLTFNETSTGVTNPLAQLAAEVRAEAPEALIIVDAISGLGAMPFQMDAWGLDVVVTGSQKSWMIPPGLAMVAVSERGWVNAERATMPRFYFDLVRHRDSLAKGQTPWTPAVSLCFQLEAALELIEAEGYESIFARHAACGAATRAGLTAMGFGLFAEPAHASDTVTSVHMPGGVEWTALNKLLRERGLVLAGGQGRLSGQIFRVGHLGDVQLDDIVSALEVLEAAARELGLAVEPGVGPAAARQAAEDRLAGLRGPAAVGV